jgi:AcrR family transcriptional regulator
MKRPKQQLDTTRSAILDALAQVIVESKEFGFSVQQVADRAEVTHRTVYNHFPTRDAMNEGLAVYLEERLKSVGPAPDAELALASFPAAVEELYHGLSQHEVHGRAYVMLMVASRTPARLTRARLRQFEAVEEDRAALPAGLTPRHVAAAIRMFVSSTGWHVLTDQFGLSSREASVAATWATRTLVDALSPKPRQQSRAQSARASAGRTRRPAKGKPHATKPADVRRKPKPTHD